MKKFALACIATASIASADGLALGYDRALTGVQGVSAILDANQLALQGILGFSYSSKEDKNDALTLAVRGLAPMGSRDNLTLRGGLGLSILGGSSNNKTQFLLETPIIAQYKFSKNFGISTQVGLVFDLNDGMAMTTNGSLLGNAGFHIFF